MRVSANKDFAIVRVISIGVVVGLVLYVALVVAPFFSYQLHLQEASAVASGAFDPKGYPLYSTGGFGIMISLLAIVATLLTPIGLPAAALLMSVPLVHGWRQFSRVQRRVSVGVILLMVGWLVFTLSPLGRLILTWFLD